MLTATTVLTDDALLKLCDDIGVHSTCPKAQVGAILCRDGQVVQSGWNGTPNRITDCYRAGCVVIPATETSREYSRHLHAEARVIAECAKFGVPTVDAWLYVSMAPCNDCARLICASGISQVVIRKASDEWMATVGAYLRQGGVMVREA